MTSDAQPQNESREHWRLKRMARHILWGMGCWAVTYEFEITKRYSENLSGGYTVEWSGKRSGQHMRGRADLAGIASMRIQNLRLRLLGQYLVLVIAEVKTSQADLKAGFIVKGGHKNYLIVPEHLADDAREVAPKHVGILGVNMGGKAQDGVERTRYHYHRSGVVRPARRQDDAIVPPWDRHENPVGCPDGWAPVLMQFACGQTRYALRWRA